MFRNIKFALLSVSAILFLSAAAYAQSRALVTQSIDENKLVTLGGNTRPEANKTHDQGPMADSTPLRGMILQLRRSPNVEQAAADFVSSLSDPKSPNFHQWLTAVQFGEKFGVSEEDINRVTSWLQSHGFAIDAISSSRMQITFSGTVSAVQGAFHTPIHNLSVNGEPHFANMKDPQIPEALAPVITGVASLHNFMPKPLNRRMNSAMSAFNVGSGYNLIAPSDLAEIYNLNPLFKAGITGKGVSIAVLEDTDIYSNDDWSYFRKEMGLSRAYPFGTFQVLYPGPGPAGPCYDPGIDPNNESEAMLDAEWASASAPNANVEMLTCADSDTTFGAFVAFQNILTLGPVPQIVSISYGLAETLYGASTNAYINSLYQQAAAQGVSVFVATGDSAAAVTDRSFGDNVAQFGINVSSLASTPYNVAVGGTDFSDFYSGTTSSYWSDTNGRNYLSAKSYVPEVPWNDSCASNLLVNYAGYTTSYGADGFCNSSNGSGFLDIAGGSGGPSGCATGTPAEEGVVGGTCAGYLKPSWQSVYGNPNDKVRDLPDVSLFASNGFLFHYYIFCDSYDQSCFGDPANWLGGGGTSFAAPIMAGMQALINQKVGSFQGNPNPVYYALADAEYGAHGNSSCNSSLGNAVSSACVFNDITQGDMDVPCQVNSSYGTLIDCYDPSGVYGVLSTSDKSYKPAYAATSGWDFATGLGSVNANNLISAYANYIDTAKHKH